MNFVYTTPTGIWAINEQDDLFSSGVFYSIYRNYPDNGWQPFKLIGISIDAGFRYLHHSLNVISEDEMLDQISIFSSANKNNEKVS